MRTHVMYLFWIYLILFSVCAKDVHSKEEVVCDPTWQLLHRSCVQFIKTKPFKSWQEARDFCLANNADLLSINDKAEKDSIGTLLREHVKSADLLYWWLGLKLSANGTWYWVDKEEFNKYLIDWASNSGKTVSGDGTILTNRCGVLDFSSNLRDEGCEQTKPFICEKIKTVQPSSSITTTPTTTPSSTSTTSTTEKGPITITPTTSDYKTLLNNFTITRRIPIPPDLPNRPKVSCTRKQQREEARAMLLEYQTEYVKGQLEMQKLEKELLEVKLRVLRAVEDKIKDMAADLKHVLEASLKLN